MSYRNHSYPLHLVLASLLLVILSCPAAHATPTFEPVFNPEMVTVRAADEIRIDGKLDDLGWQTAGRALNFVERNPGDNLPPQVETRAYLTYDDHNLYVGFICNDDPANIRATMCQRDQFNGDDAVGLLIDTYGEATWAYEFFVNPYGIQNDRMWTNVHGEDHGFDLIWHSAAQITENGYTVEMAIPFASMRFPDRDVQSWRIDFWRIHPRDSYRQYSWAANDRNEQCFPCQWGTVEGIEGVRPGKGLEVLPAYVSNQSGVRLNNGEFYNEDIKGEPSVGAKYSLSSDVTLEASLNPDFSQIEADAGQIDVNTTIALFYPERRPFFQEGSDLFRTMFNSFYTRTVNDPEFAVKGTARWDKTSLAYMTARDENSVYIVPWEEGSFYAFPGKSTVNVVRGLHSIGNNSQIGFMATDRRYDAGGSGSILSGDASIRLSRKFSWVGQFVYSHTDEPDDVAIAPGATFDEGHHTVDLDDEKYSGTALVTELRMRSRNLMFTIDYNQLTPTYQTQTGYDPWNDQRNLFAWARYNFRFDNGLFQTITPNFYTDRRWNFDTRRKWANFNVGLDMQLRWAQTYIGTYLSQGSELWFGNEYEGLWTFGINMNSRPTDQLGYGLSLRHGEQTAVRFGAKGKATNFSANLDLKPIDRLIIEPTIDFAQSISTGSDKATFYKGYIARTRVRYQATPELSLRMVVQYDDFNERWEVDPLLTYRLSSFSVFYLGSTYDYDKYLNIDNGDISRKLSSRQFFMKIQYLFQT